MRAAPTSKNPTDYRVRARIRRFPGHAGWHFVTVDKKQSNIIKTLFGNMHGGWQSLPVKVTLGMSTWRTSIFYSKNDGYYLMGLKAEVRKKEGVKEGDAVTFSIELAV